MLIQRQLTQEELEANGIWLDNPDKPRRIVTFLTGQEAIDYAGVSKQTFYKWVKRGLPVRHNPLGDIRKKVYLKEDIDQFKANLMPANHVKCMHCDQVHDMWDECDAQTVIKEVSQMQPTLKHNNTLTTKQRLTALEQTVKEQQAVIDRLQATVEKHERKTTCDNCGASSQFHLAGQEGRCGVCGEMCDK